MTQRYYSTMDDEPPASVKLLQVTYVGKEAYDRYQNRLLKRLGKGWWWLTPEGRDLSNPSGTGWDWDSRMPIYGYMEFEDVTPQQEPNKKTPVGKINSPLYIFHEGKYIEIGEARDFDLFTDAPQVEEAKGNFPRAFRTTHGDYHVFYSQEHGVYTSRGFEPEASVYAFGSARANFPEVTDITIRYFSGKLPGLDVWSHSLSNPEKITYTSSNGVSHRSSYRLKGLIEDVHSGDLLVKEVVNDR